MFEFKNSTDYEFEGPEIVLDDDCNASALRSVINDINYSRHWSEDGNVDVMNYLISNFFKMDYAVSVHQIAFDSLEMSFHKDIMSEEIKGAKIIAGGTHYDTVPNCPGADDNGSGIAILICAARYLMRNRDKLKVRPHFYFFNREEDGLLGSDIFVNKILKYSDIVPDETHIMEMVGYTSETQTTPLILPSLGSKGDFLGIVGEGIVDPLVCSAGRRVNGLKVKGLDIPFEVAKIISDSLRSDHTPFWKAGYKTCMYTDTSNFRNPNYHKPSDKPDTLDYEFMEKVLKLFLTQFF